MLEHVPYGQIIFLNRTSSSGKTSIAEELLEQLPTLYFYVPFDALNAMRSRNRPTMTHVSASWRLYRSSVTDSPPSISRFCSSSGFQPRDS